MTSFMEFMMESGEMLVFLKQEDALGSLHVLLDAWGAQLDKNMPVLCLLSKTLFLKHCSCMYIYPIQHC